jgi:hypothetical protein
MANTFTLISTASLSSTASNISFTSIPSTYTDLVLQFATRVQNTSSNDGWDTIIKFNGVATNLSFSSLRGDGTGVNWNAGITDRMLRTSVPSDWTASTFSNSRIYIPNYQSSFNKSFNVESVTENNATAAAAIIISGLWSNTAAITQIDLTASGAGSPGFVSGTIASLYGISKS